MILHYASSEKEQKGERCCLLENTASFLPSCTSYLCPVLSPSKSNHNTQWIMFGFIMRLKNKTKTQSSVKAKWSGEGYIKEGIQVPCKHYKGRNC